MCRRLFLSVPLALLAVFTWTAFQSPGAKPVGIPGEGARRLEVLFLGSENKFDHDPIARFRVIRKALGPKGINFTYSESLDALTPDNLARYDVLLLFANHDTIDGPQRRALLEFARNGGGCVLLHCAAGCFRNSSFVEYTALLGAQFKSHKSGVFRAKIVNQDHPITRGWEGFECWDETYVHHRHQEDRVILQEREGEPWTWVKSYGKGRVFYTASGHDHRCWNLPQYHDLIHRAIRWTAGDEKTALLDRLALPELNYRPAAVPKDPADPVGPLNQIQHPLPPGESLKLAQIPPGFELKLFASEPMIVNPISLNWDHRGRLWVVEAFDYPHKAGTEDPQDRIKILEDTDRDGLADKVTIFAEGLNICTSALPVEGGVIATDGVDMVFLADRDGDDQADERKVIWSGIGLRDTHACTSNLRHGFDGWIYATVGYSGLDTLVAGKRHKSGSGVFRFKADGSDFEILQNTSNNTWGIGFTEQGDLVGSTANGNPSWYLTIPNRYYELVGEKPQQVARADRKEVLYPITTDYFQNNPKEQSSSGAGHAIYTARRFPEDWWNRRAFVCEPPMHLVAAPLHQNVGDTFQTTRFENNLYASADAWSAPAAAEVGPDGAVWIADWYNPICNHNPFRPHHQLGPGNAHRNDDRDREHGRIYRISPKGSRDDPFPKLTTPAECVEGLKHPNLFWRLTAQHRFLALDEGDTTVLVDGQVGAPDGLKIHQIGQTLQARKQLAGTSDEYWGPLQVARLLRRGSGGSAAYRNQRYHPLARKEAALELIEPQPDPKLGRNLAKLLIADETIAPHEHLSEAFRLAVLRHPEGFVEFLLENQVAPDHPGVRQALTSVLERFKADKSVLSSELVALATNADGKLARLVLAAAGAPPPAKKDERLSTAAQRGKKLYFSCVACHQANGEGLPGTFPPLVNSPRVLGNEETLIKIILKGLKGPITTQDQKFDGLMPGHGALLTDPQIADLLSYVRGAWGHQAGDIEPTTVQKVRNSIKDRKAPWVENELP